MRQVALTLICVVFAASAARGTDAPLADAAEKVDWARVKHLVDEHADLNAAQVDGMTALHWAAYQDNAEAAKVLVAAGANAKAENRYGVAPLSLACTNGNEEVVRLLLKAGGARKNTPRRGGAGGMDARR